MVQLLWFVLAGVVAFIAHTKGRNPTGWFIYAFVLCPVALVHVLLIKSEFSEDIQAAPESNGAEQDDMRYCPFCTESIKKKATRCNRCGKKVEPLVSKGIKNSPEAMEADRRRVMFQSRYPVAGRSASAIVERNTPPEKQKKASFAGRFEKTTGQSRSKPIRMIVAILVALAVVGIGFLDKLPLDAVSPSSRRQPTDVVPAVKTRLQAFTERKQEIVAQAKLALEDGRLDEVLSIIEPYGGVDDPDLKALRNKAKEIALLDKVKELPASDPVGNYEGYAELARLDPSNEQYRKKKEHYEKVLSKYGRQPMKDNSGSYPEVVAYLKERHPKGTSLSMGGSSEPRFGKSGWVVLCEYRTWKGRGKTTARKDWFLIRKGKVVGMAPFKARK